MVRFHRPRRSDTGRLPLSSKIKALVFAIAAFTLIYLVIDDDGGNNAAVETQVRDLNSANNAILRGGGVADSPHSAATQNENNSLLDTYSESNLPLCSAMRISLSGSTEFDENKPTIFTDWSPDAINKWKDRNSFTSNYGKYPQYVKGGDVQPLKNSQGEKCTARTSTLINVLEERFNSGNNYPQMKDDILFFTNDVENPDFIESIKDDLSIPEPISQHSAFDDSGSTDKGFTVFSAMEQGSSHPFHFHDAAWLGQISGARLWYLLPPGTSKTTVGAKVNGCDYLTGAAPIPNGANACIQRSGEVFYLPPNWLHATQLDDRAALW